GVFNGGTFTLTANGQNLYYTGATTGNSGTIAVGSGSFTFVNDQRSVTTAKTLNNSSTAAADWGTGLGTLTSGTASGGLTVTGTNINNQGVVYGSTVEIQGISTGAAKDLRYIEAAGITVGTSASSFSGRLTLLGHGGGVTVSAGLTAAGDLTLQQDGDLPSGTNGITTTANLSSAGSIRLDAGSYRISLGGNLTSTSATVTTIAVKASSLTLTRAITSSNAAVTLTLTATTGVAYDNLNGAAATAAGFKWTTGGQNLTLTLDATNTTASALAVGTGTIFSLGAGSLSSTVTGTGGFGANSYFTNDLAITNNATLRAALTAASATDNNAEYHSLSELTAGVSATGFSGLTGDVSFSATATTVYSDSNTVVRFFKVVNGSLTRSLVAKSVRFIGSNSLSGKIRFNTSQSNGDLTLTGALGITGGDLSLALGTGK
ncbi:MAG: hypothetical protein ORO03_06950, partial [Alphaproteobacteria bacterium]|nr:hypothetical protein [Alphaproteobacteria bacterium]